MSVVDLVSRNLPSIGFSPHQDLSLREVPMAAFLLTAISHCNRFGVADTDVRCPDSPSRDTSIARPGSPPPKTAQLSADTTFHDLFHTFASTHCERSAHLRRLPLAGPQIDRHPGGPVRHLVPEASGRVWDALDKMSCQAFICLNVPWHTEVCTRAQLRATGGGRAGL